MNEHEYAHIWIKDSNKSFHDDHRFLRQQPLTAREATKLSLVVISVTYEKQRNDYMTTS